jgi:hypothetical protein
MRANPLALIAILISAFLLRLLRMHVRWDELTLAYAAYPEPLTHALEQGHPTALLGSWVGLHPPLWGIVHAVTEVIAPIPWVWMGTSALLSVAAVAVVGRVGGIPAALVLATAPVHLLDSAEVNNYPMASFLVACLFLVSRASWPWLALVAVAAGWTHLLAGVVAIAVVAWRMWSGPASERWKLLGCSVLGLLPVAAGALRLMGEGSTWAQPDVPFMQWGLMIVEAVGIEGVLLSPLVVMGLVGAVRVGWLTLSIGLVIAVSMGAAAAHQRPYLGLVAPIAALAVAETVRRYPKLLGLVFLLCCVRGVRFAAEDIERFSLVRDDLVRERGVDVALAGAEEGDTIWLVSPALQADDDKTATGEVMWRFRPWSQMTIARPVDFEYKDYRYGQPRTWNGRTVHTSTELDSMAFDHVAVATLERGSKVWVVLYDHAPATGLTDRLKRVLQPYDTRWRTVGDDRGLGRDRVVTVEAIQ